MYVSFIFYDNNFIGGFISAMLITREFFLFEKLTVPMMVDCLSFDQLYLYNDTIVYQ